ncbi:MAG: ATP-binding protein [Acidobacteriota bacterium]|nr:ATP-binding protein [Acidobacteriota bacterium]
MIEEEQPKAEDEREESGRVVYSRTRAARRGVRFPPSLLRGRFTRSQPPSATERLSLAPALSPLLIGFALLMILIIGLGVLSVKQLQRVSGRALNLERQSAGNLKNLLLLQIALSSLDNEARARARSESSGAIRLPFDLRLRNARQEVRDALTLFERLRVAQTERGSALRNDVTAFLEMSNSPDEYSLNGFAQFQKIKAEVDDFLRETSREQEEIPEIIEAEERAATERIQSLTAVAVLTGLIVTAATGWEVQRRFRQIRASLIELRRERQFSTQMLEGMVSGVAAVDQDGRIRSVNAAFLDVFPGATLGGSIHDQVATPEAGKMLAAAINIPVERPTYRGRWLLLQGPNGDQSTFDVYVSPVEIGAGRGQIITLVDATEAAEAEVVSRRQESLAAVGQATAQVAHEIKNPLGSIRLGVAMLRDMSQDPEAISTIDLVDRGIDHLSKLTSDVTQFSRRRQLSLEPTDVRALLDGSLDLVADKVKEKGTPVEKHYGAEPIIIECDEDQMRQVFLNLLANAVDASAPGSPVTVTTEHVAGSLRDHRHDGVTRPTQFARITIADLGSGMDKPTRARIFEPFFTTKKRGTGLGLAIAKQIIDQHGGRIAVESAPDKGTLFQIDMPLNVGELGDSGAAAGRTKDLRMTN